VSEFPPQTMRYRALHVGETATTLVALYGPRLPEMTEFGFTGMRGTQPGTLDSLTLQLANARSVTAVTIEGPDRLLVEIDEFDKEGQIWSVLIRRGHEHVDNEWLSRLLDLLREAPIFPGLLSAAVERQQSSMTSFVPEPPIARANHAVLTTDAEVAEAYEDPAVFWRQWDQIEQAGAWKMCIRGLGKIDEHGWLGRTYESTMALVRTAKPGLTRYGAAYWEPEMAMFWEFGDVKDEKGGYPALAPLDYDAETRTYDMVGFITKTPMGVGGEEPRHVLIREIYYLRKMLRAKQHPNGRPVESVRITFGEEWMARQERRPLLDAGARVFYGKGIEIKD
jgi:hypothetical protein